MENELCGLSTALTTILKKETLAKILSGSFQRPPREGNLHGTGNGDNTDIFFFIENEKKKKAISLNCSHRRMDVKAVSSIRSLLRPHGAERIHSNQK